MGVPQGSILRLTLFSVYIFFGHPVNKPSDRLQCHATLLLWLPTSMPCNSPSLASHCFNRSLTTPACNSHVITLDGSDLEYVDNYKYLGVWLDCKLSFQTHIKHTLVKLTILPILDFGDVIYKIASNTLLSKMDAVYHNAILLFTQALYTTHHCDLYALVGWLTRHIHRQTHWLQVIF
jgi:hypothetical protein